MEKYFEQCAAIKFCCKAEFMATKTWEMFVKAFGELSASHATVFRWHSWFATVEESIEDADWNGRPETKKTNENIAQVAAVLKDDCCASCRIIAESTGYLPKTIIRHILRDNLKKQKLCARFVSHVLTVEQWEQHVVHAKDLTIPYSINLSPPPVFVKKFKKKQKLQHSN